MHDVDTIWRDNLYACEQGKVVGKYDGTCIVDDTLVLIQALLYF